MWNARYSWYLHSTAPKPQKFNDSQESAVATATRIRDHRRSVNPHFLSAVPQVHQETPQPSAQVLENEHLPPSLVPARESSQVMG